MKKVLALSMTLLMAFGACQTAFANATNVSILGEPMGIYNADGVLLVADRSDNVIYQIEDGKTNVYSGKSAVKDIYGNALGYYYDGSNEEAYYGDPYDITSYLNGYAVTDKEFNVIRYISDYKVYTIAGNENAGYKDDSGVKARFNGPTGITTDDEGNLYVSDTQNNVIRKIDTKGRVTTFAGTKKEGYKDGEVKKATFNQPTGIDWYNGALYVCDTGNQRIRKIENGKVTTFAGAAEYYVDSDGIFEGGYQDGKALQAQFADPMGILVEKGIVYVADSGNSAIRKIENGVVSTILANNDPDNSTYPAQPRDMAIVDGMLYISDSFAGLVYSLNDALGKTDSGTMAAFDDVKQNDWYYKAVTFMKAKGYISGTEVNKFSPDMNMTKGMFVAVLGRICEDEGARIEDKPCQYSDVKDGMYYTKYAQWAKEKGIAVASEGGKFYPEENITRQEMMVMLYNAAKYLGKDVEVSGYKTIYSFNDRDKVAYWAVDAANWAYNAGIVSGRGDNMLAPEATATRAEVSQIFMQYLQNN
ncbi:MAG: S-layer homology domain-containing protein [Firmicutes bacterium]|nr:S-layer homology domain-containing protein [Bacillota bacterium]